MTPQDARERAIQVLSLLPVALVVAALTCPATDIEPPWDAGPEDAGPTEDASEPAGPADDATGGDAGDGPWEPAPPPTLAPLACAEGETRLAGCCTVVGSRSAAIRWATDRPSTGAVECAAGAETVRAETGRAASEQRAVVAPLEPSGGYGCTVEAGEAPSAAVVATLALVAGGATPWVVVTEVLPNPTGPEPSQEFVEIANLGDAPVDLGGWRLEDEGDGASTIPSDLVIGAGETVLLVADGYDARGAGDPPAAAGARIVRVGGSLATSGLRNTGEMVFLVDPRGEVVSRYGDTLGGLADGVSAVRTPAESPEGDPSAWTRSTVPTPGRL